MKEVANTYRIQMLNNHHLFYFFRRTDMKGDPISSGYLSDHESKLQDMVQQLSVESQDSRFCYLTSSEVRRIRSMYLELQFSRPRWRWVSAATIASDRYV